MFDLAVPLFVGLAGSLHCLGMCGPLVLAYSMNLNTPATGLRRSWREGVLHHVAFHAGRIFTYSLLGALGALLFHLAGAAPLLRRFSSGMTLLAGIVMVLLALVMLRLLPVPRWSELSPGAGHGLLFRLVRSRSVTSKYLLGFAVGFLPCMLPWAMLVKAASSQQPLTGFVTMLLFGLGTVPVLFFTGLSASLFSKEALGK